MIGANKTQFVNGLLRDMILRQANQQSGREMARGAARTKTKTLIKTTPMCEQIPTDIFISKNQNPNPGSESEGGKQQNVSLGKRTITTCQNVKTSTCIDSTKKV